MSRRDFLTLLGAAAVAWPLVARSEDRSTPFHVAILGSGRASDRLSGDELEWLRQGLQAERLVEGRDFVLEARYADGDYSRFKELARDALARQPGAITASTIAAAKAAQELTRSVPIVMLGLNDPVGVGLIPSLAKPSGNITGVATLNEETQLKLFQLLREALPNARAVTAFVNPRNPSSRGMIAAVRHEAVSAGMSIEVVEVATPDALDGAFEQVARRRPDVVFLIPDNSLWALSGRIVAAATAQRLPVVASLRELTEAGGLMSYGWIRQEAIHLAARYLRQIADGAKPADLPVQQPTNFRLAINQKSAVALGITIPRALLDRADDVIE
jgi:putative ABC transport system substrate-binding protein